jgi:hypothetical protein
MINEMNKIRCTTNGIVHAGILPSDVEKFSGLRAL